MIYPLLLNLLMSCAAFFVALKLITGVKPMFLRVGLHGKDLNKIDNQKM